jgi:hypothetical protein
MLAPRFAQLCLVSPVALDATTLGPGSQLLPEDYRIQLILPKSGMHVRPTLNTTTRLRSSDSDSSRGAILST